DDSIKGKASADPYDSHPPLAERLRTLGQERSAAPAADGPTAIGLLGDVAAVESALLQGILGEARVRSLRPVRWEGGSNAILVPKWRKSVSLGTIALKGLTVDGLPDAARALGKNPFGGTSDVDRNRAWLLGAGLGFALHKAGWTAVTSIGEPVRLVRDGAD